tara:strand:- start:219 stop:515 length:297 start_codon:yes stop_codon:yes gene_type:complete
MDKDLHVDEEYKRSFNEGYMLAKELGMSSSDLQGINSNKPRILGLHQGIKQFENEMTKSKDMKPNQRKVFDRMDEREQRAKKASDKPKDKGRDIDMEP